jgi:hypothetical protein
MPTNGSATLGPTAEEQDMPYSIVLLLRNHQPLSEHELQSAAERAWATSFDGKHDPMYFVSVSGEHAFVKADKHVIKMLSISQPHLGIRTKSPNSYLIRSSNLLGRTIERGCHWISGIWGFRRLKHTGC